MSDSVRPHRGQPTRFPSPWDSPGKNNGVDCHFLLQCMKVKSETEVSQSCLTLRDPMDCSPQGSSVHGIFQARSHWSGVPLPSLGGALLVYQKPGVYFRLYYVKQSSRICRSTQGRVSSTHNLACVQEIFVEIMVVG